MLILFGMNAGFAQLKEYTIIKNSVIVESYELTNVFSVCEMSESLIFNFSKKS